MTKDTYQGLTDSSHIQENLVKGILGTPLQSEIEEVSHNTRKILTNTPPVRTVVERNTAGFILSSNTDQPFLSITLQEKYYKKSSFQELINYQFKDFASLVYSTRPQSSVSNVLPNLVETGIQVRGIYTPALNSYLFMPFALMNNGTLKLLDSTYANVAGVFIDLLTFSTVNIEQSAQLWVGINDNGTLKMEDVIAPFDRTLTQFTLPGIKLSPSSTDFNKTIDIQLQIDNKTGRIIGPGVDINIPLVPNSSGYFPIPGHTLGVVTTGPGTSQTGTSSTSTNTSGGSGGAPGGSTVGTTTKAGQAQ